MKTGMGVPEKRALTGGLFLVVPLALASAGCASGASGLDQESVDRVESAFSCTGVNCSCGPTFGIGLVQGTMGSGTIHNFELVVPHAGGGFSHYYRENQEVSHVVGQTWKGPSKFGSDPDVAGVAALEHSQNGNLEVIAVIGNRLVHFWRDRNTLQWSNGYTIATGVTGQPGFVQSTSTTTPNNNRNFEVVVPLASGGLAHYWRNHTVPSLPWVGPNVFATGRTYQAVSLVESNFSANRLEVIARSGPELYFTWRTDNWVWQTPSVVSVGGQPIPATGVHQFIQGRSGTRGNFELIVPAPAGGLQHYYRDNDDSAANYPWYSVGAVDPITTNTYTSAGVIWSEYENLEVVGRRSTNGALAAFFYQGGWNRHGQNSSGQTVWAGQVFGGEPCCDPATKGVWSDPINSGAIGIHSALLHTGKVLFFGFENDENMGHSEVFDPAAPNSPQAPGGTHQPHAFCSGHAFLSDGRLWVSGGHGDAHVKGSHVFNPSNQEWTQLYDMPNGRWYPTLTRLGDGTVLAISGSSKSGPLTSSNPVNSTWQTLNTSLTLGAEQNVPNPFSSDGRAIELYPFQYLLPDGRLFVHSRRTSRFFSPSENAWNASQYNTLYAYGRTYPGNGSSVLLPLSPTDNYRARILVLGGSGDIIGGTDNASKEADSTIPATDTVEELDLGASPVQWRSRASMTFARVLHTATLLPDGKVFVSGGSYVGRSDNGNAPVQTPELYDPATNSWTLLCAMRVARLYHSTALLLPDARVLTAGRDHAFNALPYKWPERRIEIFTPPYLLNGQPRPVLSTVPATVTYNTNFNVTVTNAVAPSNINRAVLMSPGSVTHGFDMGQRAIQLQIVSQSNSTGTLTLNAPPTASVAPPGYYMLFLLSNQGVPSVAKFIKL